MPWPPFKLTFNPGGPRTSLGYVHLPMSIPHNKPILSRSSTLHTPEYGNQKAEKTTAKIATAGSGWLMSYKENLLLLGYQMQPAKTDE